MTNTNCITSVSITKKIVGFFIVKTVSLCTKSYPGDQYMEILYSCNNVAFCLFFIFRQRLIKKNLRRVHYCREKFSSLDLIAAKTKKKKRIETKDCFPIAILYLFFKMYNTTCACKYIN